MSAVARQVVENSRQQENSRTGVTENLMDGPCDRPRNHTILCGARVCEATAFGESSGRLGTVIEVSVHMALNPNKSTSRVTYEVLLDDGEPRFWQPLQLYRESRLSNAGIFLLSCSNLAVCLFQKDCCCSKNMQKMTRQAYPKAKRKQLLNILRNSVY